MNSKVMEIFGASSSSENVKWNQILESQRCPFLKKKCIKVRKSQPEVAIGTCTVRHGRGNKHIVICPHRLLERQQIFTDCLHLLTLHEPGNELHIMSEISIPGGSVDYFLGSVDISTEPDKSRDKTQKSKIAGSQLLETREDTTIPFYLVDETFNQMSLFV